MQKGRNLIIIENLYKCTVAQIICWGKNLRIIQRMICPPRSVGLSSYTVKLAEIVFFIEFLILLVQLSVRCGFLVPLNTDHCLLKMGILLQCGLLLSFLVLHCVNAKTPVPIFVDIWCTNVLLEVVRDFELGAIIIDILGRLKLEFENWAFHAIRLLSNMDVERLLLKTWSKLYKALEPLR